MWPQWKDKPKWSGHGWQWLQWRGVLLRSHVAVMQCVDDEQITDNNAEIQKQQLSKSKTRQELKRNKDKNTKTQAAVFLSFLVSPRDDCFEVVGLARWQGVDMLATLLLCTLFVPLANSPKAQSARTTQQHRTSSISQSSRCWFLLIFFILFCFSGCFFPPNLFNFLYSFDLMKVTHSSVVSTFSATYKILWQTWVLSTDNTCNTKLYETFSVPNKPITRACHSSLAQSLNASVYPCGRFNSASPLRCLQCDFVKACWSAAFCHLLRPAPRGPMIYCQYAAAIFRQAQTMQQKQSCEIHSPM